MHLWRRFLAWLRSRPARLGLIAAMHQHDPGDEADTPQEWGIVPNRPTRGSVPDLVNGCPRCGRTVVRRQRDAAKHCRKCQRTFYPTHGEEKARVVILPDDWPHPDDGVDEHGW